MRNGFTRYMETPWGPAYTEERLAPGVVQVTTPSHGGLKLDAAAQQRIPLEVRDSFINGHGWAEEDCEALIVLVLLAVTIPCMTRRQAVNNARIICQRCPRYAPALPHLPQEKAILMPDPNTCPECHELVAHNEPHSEDCSFSPSEYVY